MLELHCVKTFLSVIECGGFRQAGLQIGISQSAVTQHLKRLEQTLQVCLIERKNSRCCLTNEGAIFIPYAKKLTEMSEHASNLFTKKKLSVGASSNVGIYSLQPYLKRYQELSAMPLDVVISDNVDIAEKLMNLELDIALMEWWDHRPGFVSRVWRTDELVLIVANDHPWARLETVPQEYLYGAELLGGEAGTGTGRLIEQYFGSDANRIGISMRLGSTEAVKRAVQAGLGISLVLASTVELERTAGLFAVLSFRSVHQPVKKIMAVQRTPYVSETAQVSKFMEILFEESSTQHN